MGAAVLMDDAVDQQRTGGCHRGARERRIGKRIAGTAGGPLGARRRVEDGGGGARPVDSDDRGHPVTQRAYDPWGAILSPTHFAGFQIDRPQDVVVGIDRRGCAGILGLLMAPLFIEPTSRGNMANSERTSALVYLRAMKTGACACGSGAVRGDLRADEGDVNQALAIEATNWQYVCFMKQTE